MKFSFGNVLRGFEYGIHDFFLAEMKFQSCFKFRDGQAFYKEKP